MALVITRRRGEKVHIGDRIVVSVGKIFPDGRIRLVIDAPRDIRVVREELTLKPVEVSK